MHVHLKAITLVEEAKEKGDTLYDFIPVTGQEMQGNLPWHKAD